MKAEVLPASEQAQLDELAMRIHVETNSFENAVSEAFEARLAVGQALLEARELLPSDQAFGAWFDEQGFKFNRPWAYVLRQGAVHEIEMRAVASQLATGESFNFEKTVKQVAAAAKPEPDPKPDPKPAPGRNLGGERGDGVVLTIPKPRDATRRVTKYQSAVGQLGQSMLDWKFTGADKLELGFLLDCLDTLKGMVARVEAACQAEFDLTV